VVLRSDIADDGDNCELDDVGLLLTKVSVASWAGLRSAVADVVASWVGLRWAVADIGVSGELAWSAFRCC
jgi:hypothetical protein